MYKLTAKERRKLVLKTFLCVFIIGLSIILSMGNLIKIKEKTDEKEILTKKLQELEEEEVILTDDVEKLKNPEYAARYAREKYLYSKMDEIILKLN